MVVYIQRKILGKKPYVVKSIFEYRFSFLTRQFIWDLKCFSQPSDFTLGYNFMWSNEIVCTSPVYFSTKSLFFTRIDIKLGGLQETLQRSSLPLCIISRDYLYFNFPFEYFLPKISFSGIQWCLNYCPNLEAFSHKHKSLLVQLL